MAMYKARFVSDSGPQFLFAFENGVIFDIDPLSGVNVNLATAQGYGHAGDVVMSRTIGSVTRKISGVFIKENEKKKRDMQAAFAPFSTGRLYFNDLYYCECNVKQTPQFFKKDTREMFSIQVLCAYPFWKSAEDVHYGLGTYEPAFEFPVNYAEPHMFGIKNPNQFIDVYNDGEETATMTIEFSTLTVTENYGILNIDTGEYIRITDTLNIGDKMRVFWKNNVLKLQKTASDGSVSDAFTSLDEESTLFTVAPGHNVFLMQAESGLNDLVAFVSFPGTKAGVYDGIK